MWTTIRSLQEATILMRQLSTHAEEVHGAGSGARLQERADEVERRADALRDLLQTSPAAAMEPVE
jgi:hypothetical protein